MLLPSVSIRALPCFFFLVFCPPPGRVRLAQPLEEMKAKNSFLLGKIWMRGPFGCLSLGEESSATDKNPRGDRGADGPMLETISGGRYRIVLMPEINFGHIQRNN